jgi:hypothetical protein
MQRKVKSCAQLELLLPATPTTTITLFLNMYDNCHTAPLKKLSSSLTHIFDIGGPGCNDMNNAQYTRLMGRVIVAMIVVVVVIVIVLMVVMIIMIVVVAMCMTVFILVVIVLMGVMVRMVVSMRVIM